MAIVRMCEIKKHGRFTGRYCPKCKSSGRMVNHRPLFKILLNPILRLFGYQIVSVFSSSDEKFICYKIMKVPV